MSEIKNYQEKWIKGVAIALGLMGLINIISAWFSYDSLRFKLIKEFFDYQLIIGSRYLVVVTGIASLLIAPSLFKQKRVAWYISIILLGVSGIAHIIKGADVEEASLCMLLLGILLPLYRDCSVKSDPIRVQRSGKILLGAVIFVFLYTFVGFHFFADKLGLNQELSLWKAGFNSLFFDFSGLQMQNKAARFFCDSIIVVNSFSILIGLLLALSPVVVRAFPEINIEEYKKTAAKFAKQAVQIFSLSNGYIHFSPSGNTGEYISYKVSNGVALMIGNPCTENSFGNITETWLEHIKEYDWTPAYYQNQDEFHEYLKNKGFLSIPIGVEALINLETFSLEGKEMQELRSAKNRAEKEGWLIRKFSPSAWDKVRNIDKKWLKIHGNKEIGLAMGKSSLKYLSETKTSLLFDKDENLLAYVNNIELPGSNSRAVDLMRRDPEIKTKFVMESLFLNEILEAKTEGKAYYDLGLSPLAEMDKSLADNKIAFKLLTLVYNQQKNFYDFKGLHHFKSKFKPEWRQSFLTYPSQASLPSILFALLNLNKGS